MILYRLCTAASLTVICCFTPTASASERATSLNSDVVRVDLLPPGPGNPRNSEGDFVELKDGRVLFVYTHFTGGAGDDAAAHLASRVSNDGGRTWSEKDVSVIANEAGFNVMSVSLLRLHDGRIALFYLRKESRSDCRPVMRVSSDEAKSWSDPVEIISDDEIGYYVLNNDRVVQLDNGRLVTPLAQHYGRNWDKWRANADMLCYFSDDAGRTWQRGAAAPPAMRDGRTVTLQEPGIAELADKRLLMLCRTDAGSQYICHSSDGGATWTEPLPSSIISPLSPATVERIPGTDDLLLVWNDHQEIAPELRGKRTPLRLAVSRDQGVSWRSVATIEDDPHGWYCYTAVEFVGENVLLGYCAGDRRENNGLAATRITVLPRAMLR